MEKRAFRFFENISEKLNDIGTYRGEDEQGVEAYSMADVEVAVEGAGGEIEADACEGFEV